LSSIARNSASPSESPPADSGRRAWTSTAAWIAMAVAVLGRLPSLGGYWNGEDWTLLARAAGLDSAGAGAARFLSRTLYWEGLLPLFGLSTDPWTWTRMLLHGGAAAMVVRIAGRSGLGPWGRLFAGLIYAVTPLAFTPLYRGDGIQELLGAFLILAAIDALLAGGGRRLVYAVLMGIMAIFSNENALCLPLICAGAAAFGDRRLRRGRSAATAVLTAAAVAATVLLLDRPGIAPASAHPLLSPGHAAASLPESGWWLIDPRLGFPQSSGAARLFIGTAVWIVWLGVAVRSLRRLDRRIAYFLAASLLSLVPALLLAPDRAPQTALPATAGFALSIGCLPIRHRIPIRTATVVLSAALAFALGIGHTQVRIKARDASGLPADPAVRGAAIGWEAARTLESLPEGPWDRVILFQPSIPTTGAVRATLPGLPRPTPLYTALGGGLGPRLLMSGGPRCRWSTTLTDKAIGSLVLVDTGVRLKIWGPLPQAMAYDALTDIAYGRHEQARRSLLATMKVSHRRLPFFYDPGLMVAPPELLQAQAPAFLAHLAAAGGDSTETAALTATAGEMLAACGALN